MISLLIITIHKSLGTFGRLLLQIIYVNKNESVDRKYANVYS